mgnify:CR=1 FL=1
MNKLLFFLLLCGVNVQAAQEKNNIELLGERITQMTENFMEEEKVFVGVQAAILYKNELIFNKGFGYTDVENNKPFLAIQ